MTESRTPLILFNDDGWIMSTYGPPITPEIMRDKMIAPYEGSPVDVFLWSIGGHEVYDYETGSGSASATGTETGTSTSDSAGSGTTCAFSPRTTEAR